MNRSFISGLIILCLCFACNNQSQSLESDPFSKNVRPTEARTPEQEKAGFQLPPGFEIQLFASEPNIGKPLNMAFDSKGRMWLTQSNDYPFPDSNLTGNDQISILEDTDGDGTADKFTVFADSLNIPIGITTVPDGAIAYSIPHIYHFIDKDGDDKADQRKEILSGFEYKDTHGMINNFVRSWDGWIHADHGFANNSKVYGIGTDTLAMSSGNTFRFKPDGSQVEFTTTGRVNPFGYAYDEWGYTYSVDCHTSPVYQLVRGADYPHFGKQPTGIGFGPALMKHEYGATAL
ncbi:MAG: dehydrogenase, partial [Bacteroidia bacterium]